MSGDELFACLSWVGVAERAVELALWAVLAGASAYSAWRWSLVERY